MLEKFLTNKNDLKLIQWLLKHPFDFYTASTIGLDIGLNPKELAESLHTLALYNMIIEEHDLNGDATYFNIKLNTDSNIVKALFELNTALEDYLYTDQMFDNTDMDELQNQIDQVANRLDDEHVEEMVDKIKNWRTDLPEPKNWAEQVMHDNIAKELEQMEESGELEDFIEFIKNINKM